MFFVRQQTGVVVVAEVISLVVDFEMHRAGSGRSDLSNFSVADQVMNGPILRANKKNEGKSGLNHPLDVQNKY